jgi:Protein of unknown function DUF262
MEVAEARVQRVLQGDKQFLVPHFQRPYSWRESEWRVLWDDLLELLGHEDPEPHFLGSIVTAPARTVPEGIEKRLLIDGQQRLTTIVLLLALLRERAIVLGNSRLAERIVDLILNRHEEGSDRHKLLPTQGETSQDSDRDALMSLVDGRELSSTSAIQAARTYFNNKLARSDAPDLDALFKVITGKLTLVSIILDEKDNPHRIFESLNGKGRPLSQADLIRNYFFMRLPVSQHDTVHRQLWQPMQRRLGEERLRALEWVTRSFADPSPLAALLLGHIRGVCALLAPCHRGGSTPIIDRVTHSSALTEFVRHYLMHFGQLVKESDVYTTLKTRVDRSESSPFSHLEDLVQFAGYYEVLLQPDKAPATAIRERLHRLHRFEVTVAYPFLLPFTAPYFKLDRATDRNYSRFYASDREQHPKQLPHDTIVNHMSPKTRHLLGVPGQILHDLVRCGIN